MLSFSVSNLAVQKKSRLRTAIDEKLDESLGTRLGHLSLPVSPTLDEPEFILSSFHLPATP